MAHKTGRGEQGFTLVELAIVLVIIGLIIGGVLVGKDMIDAATIRAQITQISKYNTAVHAFQLKYSSLPGDIPDPDATRFGFQARGTSRGQGDGNGVVEGGSGAGVVESWGETVVFWTDLSAAHLIDGNFNTAVCCNSAYSGADLGLYFPVAKLGAKSNYIYVYSGGYNSGGWNSNGINYFGLSASPSISFGSLLSQAGLTIQQAYSIDVKMDDGLPQSGSVIAQYLYGSPYWAAAGGTPQGANDGNNPPGPTTNATAGSVSTCYDNSSAASGTPGVSGAIQHYSLEIKNSLPNCALSFKFQ